MLAVQLPVTKALVRSGKESQVDLIVESVAVAVRNLSAGRQTPDGIRARDVVAGSVAHVCGQGAESHHLVEFNGSIARVVIVLTEQRTAGEQSEFRSAPSECGGSAAETTVGVEVAIEAQA